MATLSEIEADLKAKKTTKKEAQAKKSKLAREKTAKRTKKLLSSQSGKTYNDRRRLAAQKNALKNDLKGEERLAKSRTQRARGRGDTMADMTQRGAIAAKKASQRNRDTVESIDRVSKLRKEGKSRAEIFRDRLDKKPVVKKPVVKRAKSTIESQDAKPNKSNAQRPDFTPKPVDKKADREKGLLTDKTIRNRAKKDDSSTLKKLFGASEEKRAMGRNQMNRARASMGMNMGGKVKKMNMGGAPMNARGKTMADMEGRAMATGRFRDMPGKMADARGRAMKTGGMLARTGGSSAKMKAKGTRMKAGGAVKKCRMDGIALRGKTRAKERSK